MYLCMILVGVGPETGGVSYALIAVDWYNSKFLTFEFFGPK
jgi:hypothetical protein